MTAGCDKIVKDKIAIDNPVFDNLVIDNPVFDGKRKLRVLVCVSGGGTNLQALIDAKKAGRLANTELVRVISNKADAYALERAEKAGIEGICVSPKNFADREAFHRAFLSAVEEAEPEFSAPVKKFLVHGSREGWRDFDRELEQYPDTLARIPNQAADPMLLYFSSGTTGYPKMVIHNHTYAIAHIITARHWHNVVPDGLHLTVADTGWGKAVWGKLYGQWFCGAGVFVYDFDKFAPKDLLHKIQQYRITTFCAPPTIYRFFIKEGMEGYDLSSLVYATTAGEALNPEVYNRFYEYTGLRLMEGFGQTETVLSLANLAGSTPKPGSMGRPSPLYDIQVVDSDGVPVSTGDVGEIVIRGEGPTVGLMMEYYRDREKTAEAWHDGWYHTGDTVWQDEDGEEDVLAQAGKARGAV